ncbi:cellulase family glycosylhydrolase [Halogeometricum luteum]|uniref:Cellulase family glycosylhydrolase n=1 Tax=Halogeometricum luteum TaxID=2950537 RepID=A0ABU2G0Y0_9EURY|nr:cellulase family glycosylhydrolase [Halogeometricum sp. S3BR5-2]MDS0294442.1 cellulase family glycosylhydrolase [Halogeometricum sp. S3BR5-2]
MDDTEGVSRRGVLAALGAGGIATLGGCVGSTGSDAIVAAATEASSDAAPSGGTATARETEMETETPASTMTEQPSPSLTGDGLSNVRGAVYLPYRVFNHYQMWDRYAPAEIERDLTFASNLGLNSLRVFASYTVWQEDPAAFRDRFDHFLAAAADRGIAVLPMLFESIGTDPTPANVARNVPIRSPGGAVLRNRGRWAETAAFVRWFAERYGDHEGLLAIEVMNEPGELDHRVAFVREMLRVAREAHPTVPLTVGCKSLELNRQYADAIDVLQFHHNLPPTADQMRQKLGEASDFAAEVGKPVWLTEWQRTRVGPPDKMLPNYDSLADIVRDSDIDGDFFWQLMLNPAYNLKVRSMGRINGVFTEDGGVYSLEGARALAGSGDWEAPEIRPDWTGRVGSE